jgi:hypothetical protein
MVDDVDPRVVVHHDPAGQQAEQYRLPHQPRAMNPQGEPRTPLFTSAQPREGKSVTVVTIACAGRERRPARVPGGRRPARRQLHALLPSDAGPRDVLLDGVPPRKALQDAAEQPHAAPAAAPSRIRATLHQRLPSRSAISVLAPARVRAHRQPAGADLH